MAKKKKEDANPVDPDTGLSAVEIDKLAKSSASDLGKGGWGGKRRNAGSKGKAKWANLGKTKQVSIPEAVVDQVMSFVNDLDKQCSSDS